MRCERGKGRTSSISPRGTFEREFKSMDIRLLRATFVLLTLSSRPWDITKYSVLSCMHAVCLSVFVCTLSKAYFGSDPLETFSPWFPS